MVRFSERAAVEPVWRELKAVIIRNVSVGYSVRAYEITEEESKVPIWRAVAWTSAKLSAVPIGADLDACFRSVSRDPQPCRLIIRSQDSETLTLEGEHVMDRLRRH